MKGREELPSTDRKIFSIFIFYKETHTFPARLSVAKLNMQSYYMALSHEDWELQNSRIWLAKIDIDRGLDFPI